MLTQIYPLSKFLWEPPTSSLDAMASRTRAVATLSPTLSLLTSKCP